MIHFLFSAVPAMIPSPTRRLRMGLLALATSDSLLAAQTQTQRSRPLPYREYMTTFEADAPGFYRPEGRVPAWERLKSAWRGYWFPREKRH